MHLFKSELARLKDAARRVDVQTALVLVLAALLIFLHNGVGSRRFFRSHLEGYFPVYWQGVLGWGWRFSIQAVTGFVLPVCVLLVVFRRSPKAAGLGLGNVRLALMGLAAYLPVVLVGTWILSDSNSFLTTYPHFRAAAYDWTLLLVYEVFYLFYWLGWEYMWRGFLLFGTRHTFGIHAIFVQALPFAIMHADKPVAEQLLSVLGAVVLGALVWRARSFWIAVPIHALQMLFLDLWCTLRTRTGVRGSGFEELVELLRAATT